MDLISLNLLFHVFVFDVFANFRRDDKVRFVEYSIKIEIDKI